MASFSGFWPQDTVELFFVGPAAAAVLSIIVHLVGQSFAATIGLGVLKFCDPRIVKEAAKATWTSTCLVAGLLAVLSAIMVQVDAPQPMTSFDVADAVRVPVFGGPMLLLDATEREVVFILDQAYRCLCVFALLFLMVGFMDCLVQLVYVLPLTQTDTIKYFLTYPQSLGAAPTLLGEGALTLLLAVAVWTFARYGLLVGGLTGLIALAFPYLVLTRRRRTGAFDPSKIDLAWALQDEGAAAPAVTAEKDKEAAAPAPAEKEKDAEAATAEKDKEAAAPAPAGKPPPKPKPQGYKFNMADANTRALVKRLAMAAQQMEEEERVFTRAVC